MRNFETCKRCGFEECTKNGKHRNQQRFWCPKCEYNFVIGDKRVKPDLSLRKAMVAFFANNSSAPALSSSTRKYLGLSRSASDRDNARINKQFPDCAKNYTEKVSSSFNYDEIVAYIQASKPFLGGQKRWIVAKGTLSHEFEALIILRPTRKKAAKAPS